MKIRGAAAYAIDESVVKTPQSYATNASVDKRGAPAWLGFFFYNNNIYGA